LEVLGNYDPRKTNEQIKEDRVKFWISKGAQLSDTLHNMFIEKKIIEGKKVNALPKRTPIKKETPVGETPEVKAEAPKEEPKKEEVAPAA